MCLASGMPSGCGFLIVAGNLWPHGPRLAKHISLMAVRGMNDDVARSGMTAKEKTEGVPSFLETPPDHCLTASAGQRLPLGVE